MKVIYKLAKSKQMTLKKINYLHMRVNLLLLIFNLGIISVVFTQNSVDTTYLNFLKHTHDLNLPDWGPYTKKYIGVSHIPNKEQGIRFDLSVFPGFYRRKTEVPHAFYESGFHPWEASPNLEYVWFRHELEWKDRVYTDISYSLIDSSSRLVRVECVNNTDQKQSIVVHFMASIHFPSIAEYKPNTPISFCSLHLPNYARWVDALDYKSIKITESSHKDNLVYDGKLRGEIRENYFINGSGIGQEFGAKKGDSVSYEIEVNNTIEDGTLWFRYKLDEGQQVVVDINHITKQTITLKGTGKITTATVNIGKLTLGKYPVSFVSTLL